MSSARTLKPKQSPPKKFNPKDGSRMSNFRSRAKQTYLKIFNKEFNKESHNLSIEVNEEVYYKQE
jgi:aspartyl/asparaginyl beta-hydroxylase (cupin superfamily)